MIRHESYRARGGYGRGIWCDIWIEQILEHERLRLEFQRKMDPCAGAGGMLLASEKHGRLFRGAELNPRFADLIIERWERETKRQARVERP